MQTYEQIKEIVSKEKDLYEFEYKWFDCIIKRFHWHLNWYLIIPDKFISSDIEDKLEVHWWITYTGTIERIFSTDLTKDYSDKYIIWFDTAHAWDNFIDDTLPEEFKDMFIHERWTYKDYNYVKAEVESLAEQLYLLNK